MDATGVPVDAVIGIQLQNAGGRRLSSGDEMVVIFDVMATGDNADQVVTSMLTVACSTGSFVANLHKSAGFESVTSAELTPPKTSPPTETPPKKGTPTSIIYIVVGASAGVLAMGGVFFAMRRRINKQRQQIELLGGAGACDNNDGSTADNDGSTADNDGSTNADRTSGTSDNDGMMDRERQAYREHIRVLQEQHDREVETLQEAWRIEPKDLAIHSFIAEGGEGRVYRGRWRGQFEVAIKMMRRSPHHPEDWGFSNAEVNAMQRLRASQLARRTFTERSRALNPLHVTAMARDLTVAQSFAKISTGSLLRAWPVRALCWR